MPLPDVPMSQSAVKLVVPLRSPELCAVVDRPSAASAAVVVVHTTVAIVVRADVIDCVTGVKLMIRGPRPPVGLTTSVVCASVRGPAPGSFQLICKRRAAEVLAVGVADRAGRRRRADVGGRRRRELVRGVVEGARRRRERERHAPALDRPRRAGAEAARLQAGLHEVARHVRVRQPANGLDELAAEVRRGDAGVVRGRRAQRPGEHRQHADSPTTSTRLATTPSTIVKPSSAGAIARRRRVMPDLIGPAKVNLT